MPIYTFILDNDAKRSQRLLTHLAESSSTEPRLFDSFPDLQHALTEDPDLVILSLDAVDTSPDRAVEIVRARTVRSCLLLIDGPDEARRAVDLIKQGAHDYLTASGSTVSRIVPAITHVLDTQRRARQRQSLSVVRRSGAEKIVGTSAATEQLCRQVVSASQADLHVLIKGETGVGKHVVARSIHAQSDRPAPLFCVDCAIATPDEIADLLLQERPLRGDSDRASGGPEGEAVDDAAGAPSRTLLLEHVEALSSTAQSALCRILRVGDAHTPDAPDLAPVDVRLLSIADAPLLHKKLRRGAFRHDLYYKLAELTVTVPPLRERPDDIPDLAQHFLDRYAEAHDADDVTLSEDALARLQDASWPGNVRELRNLIERTADLGSGLIEADDLVASPPEEPVASRPPASEQAGASDVPSASASDMGGIVLGTDSDAILPLEALKRQAVERAYRLCDGDVDRAAVELDIGRSTLYRMLDRYDIKD